MKIIIYKDRKKEWRWKGIKNGRKVASTGEGYKNHLHCRKMVEELFSGKFKVIYQNLPKLKASDLF